MSPAKARGGGATCLLSPPKHYVGPSKTRGTFWARRAPKCPLSKLVHDHTLFNPYETQAESFICAPRGNGGPSPTLTGPYQAWHWLILEMNGHLKPELCPPSLKGTPLCLRWALSTLISALSSLRLSDPQGSLRSKTLEWDHSQTQNVPCMTRVGLMAEFKPSGMKRTFLMPEVDLT